MLKMMKYLLHTLSCLLLFAAGTCLAQTPGHTLRSGGIDRTYRLHLPEGLPDGAPLVIVLHARIHCAAQMQSPIKSSTINAMAGIYITGSA